MQAAGRIAGLCSPSSHFKPAPTVPKRMSECNLGCCGGPDASRKHARPRRAIARAEGEQTPAEAPAPSVDEEARLEALEASVRAKRGAKPSSPRVSGAASSSGGAYAEWKEGELFPEGWDQMDPLQKATELYTGKRGLLFWSTKAAWAGIITLVVAWAAFRFLGPALGLYQLSNEPPAF